MQKRTLLTALASVPLLAACGFKLRGSVDFAFKSLYLNGSANSAFLKELQRHLEAAGSLQVLRDPSQATQAEAIFDDLGQRRERVVVSRNAAGEVRELQIRLITRFRVRDAKGGIYVPDSELMQYREISYVETYALSKANEEEMLYRNMQTDIVQQIVRRLAIVKTVTPLNDKHCGDAALEARSSMQVPLNQLTAQLGKGLRSLYTVYGDEALLVQEAVDAIRASARANGYTERNSFTVAGAHFDWSTVLAAGGSLSLFADKQIIEVRIPSGKPGKEGSTALQQLVSSSVDNDSTLTIIILPRLDKATKTGAWFAALDAHGITLQVDSIERAALPAWIAQRLQRQEQHVKAGEEGQRTLAFFADRVEGNLLAAHQEIQKLGLLYPAGELGFEQVEQAVLNVARYDVFKLSDAVLSGQVLRTERMLNGLQAEGEAEVLVHWALAEDIRAMKRVKDALRNGRPMPMALRENRVWGNKERHFERVLPRISDATVARLLHSAHAVDGIVKGLKVPEWPANGWQALHRLALQTCKACSSR